MSNIRIDLEATVINGQTLTFKSPVDCSQITGLILYYPEGNTTKSTVFQFADAHGNNVGNINLFAENVLVKVIMDTDLKRAYVQNADTNAYLESRFKNLKASDVGARPDNWMPTAAEVGARPNTWMPSANDVGALPTVGGTMAGPINMGGNVIWGLGNPTGYDQAVTYRMFLDELAKKAPAGYGLGTVSTSTASTYAEDANTATLTGWYKIDSNTANGIGASAILRVEAYASTYVMQTAIRANGGVILRRYCNNGTWNDWALADNVNKEYVDNGLDQKAPSGFGLGGDGKHIQSGTNFNNVTCSGFYSWDNGCINSPFDWGTMIAVSRHGGPVQLALGHDGEARDQIAIRSLSNGTSNWQYLMKRFNLLWQNASPNSLFGAQTISVDLSAYDTVLITYNQYYENHNVAMCFVPKFCFGQLETVMTGGRYRTLLVSNDGVSFNDQLLADGSAGSNNFCIPAQIFGCKLA